MISDYINNVYQSIEEETAQPAAPIGGGLAAKPVKPTVKDDDTEDKRGVFSRIYDTMSSYFKSDDVSAMTTSPTTLNNAAKEATLNNASIVDIIKANKDTPTGSAVINIPLSRLQKPEVQFDEQKILDRFVTTPPDRPDATTVAPLAPGGAALSDGKVDEGLMSKPKIEESVTTDFSEAINSLYDTIGVAEIIEIGDNDHKGSAWESLKKAGVTPENFKPENVITDDAVKEGIKRSDYSSDEEFTKAILVKFENYLQKAIEAQGLNYDNVPEQARRGLVSYTWNAKAHKYKQMQPAFKEIVKDNLNEINMKIVQTGMLQTYTADGIVIRGLADRRATDYSDVAASLNKPTIKSYTPVKLNNGNAGFKFKFSDGTSLTDDTGKNYETEASEDDFKVHLNKEFSI